MRWCGSKVSDWYAASNPWHPRNAVVDPVATTIPITVFLSIDINRLARRHVA